MSLRVKTRARGKGQRSKLIWVSSAVAFVSALIYWEYVALLYVISTLAMCGLLLVVAFSDLKGGDKELSASTLNERAATANDTEMTTASPPYRVRRVTKRKHQDAA